MNQSIETPSRRTARLAGIFFILTFVLSIPAVLLYGPALNETDYILGSGAVGQIQLGAFLEVLLAIANIATAIVLFPVLRRLYKSGLVPRRMAMIGLIGGPIAFLSATLVLFGVYEQTSGVSFLMTLPEIGRPRSAST